MCGINGGYKTPICSGVRPERLELPTFWFVARRSNPLSYGRILRPRITEMPDTARLASPLLLGFQSAGRQGFEPWNGSYTVNRLAGGPNRPLWHLPEQEV
jgi:hypothetical protein